MPRLNVRDYRRNELIDAAIVSIAERGFGETTLASIAAEAGVSPALINHYFQGKDELLDATMRRLARDLAQTIRTLTPPAPQPIDRLHAIIDGCLKPDQLRPGAMLAWLAFWGQIPTDRRFAHFQRTINRRFRSNMMVALRRLLPPDEAEDAYLGLFAIIDGFWIRQVIDPNSFDIDQARHICRGYLAMLLSGKTKGARPRRVSAGPTRGPSPASRAGRR